MPLKSNCKCWRLSEKTAQQVPSNDLCFPTIKEVIHAVSGNEGLLGSQHACGLLVPTRLWFTKPQRDCGLLGFHPTSLWPVREPLI